MHTYYTIKPSWLPQRGITQPVSHESELQPLLTEGDFLGAQELLKYYKAWVLLPWLLMSSESL